MAPAIRRKLRPQVSARNLGFISAIEPEDKPDVVPALMLDYAVAVDIRMEEVVIQVSIQPVQAAAFLLSNIYIFFWGPPVRAGQSYAPVPPGIPGTGGVRMALQQTERL